MGQTLLTVKTNFVKYQTFVKKYVSLLNYKKDQKL